ncbi:MAG: PASTA domain-containing protein [Candidatus Margulisiibacteriota bacterium]
MLIEYINWYLIYVIIISVLLGLFVLRVKHPSLWRVLLFFFGLIIIPAIIVISYVTYFNALPQAIVPDLRGLGLQAAVEKLEGLRLQGLLAGSTYDATIPLACVVSQQPVAGERVKIGRTIKLVTSSGKRKIAVPNLLGKALGDADAILRSAGLTLGSVESSVSDEMDPGLILGQSPLPDEEIEMGNPVNITITSKEAQEEKSGFKLWPW